MANSASAASSASPSPFWSPVVRRSRVSADCAAPASSFRVEGLLDRGCSGTWRREPGAVCVEFAAAVVPGRGVDVLGCLLFCLGAGAAVVSNLPLEGPWLTLRAGKALSNFNEAFKAGFKGLLCRMLGGRLGGGPGGTGGMGGLGKGAGVELALGTPTGISGLASAGNPEISSCEAATAAAVAASEAATLANTAAAASLAAATAVAVVLLSWALAAARAERETCPETVGQEPPPGGPRTTLGPGPAAVVTAKSTECEM